MDNEPDAVAPLERNTELSGAFDVVGTATNGHEAIALGESFDRTSASLITPWTTTHRVYDPDAAAR